LQKRLTIPLAGGENIAGHENFATALSEGVLTVVQPDVAKWGGISGCIAVARDVLASKRHYCPHFLGSGIGLLASAHLLAGSGGGGLLEVDSNDNPLREDFCGAVADIKHGEIVLPDAPGLGVEPDVTAIQKYRTL
jgi:L-alanine-DL-glutamate epimerase-like enolase superfamily enzyme